MLLLIYQFFDIILIVEDRGGNVRSNKGQALIEFILILPILLIFLIGIIDFGRIIYEQNRLEGIVSDAVDLFNNGELSDEQINAKLEDYYDLDLILNVKREETNTTITLSRSIDIMTPGLNMALSDPHIVEVSRVISNE